MGPCGSRNRPSPTQARQNARRWRNDKEQRSPLHSFARSLARAQAYADLPLWEQVYRQAFPTFATMYALRRDGWAQRGGLDRLVILESGKTLWIEEKLRERDYADILLEYYSDRDRKVPGWIAQDLACDYLAYAFLPSGRCYLLPFQPLRHCWQQYRRQWVQRYGPPIEAQNEGDVSVGVAVPIAVVLAALSQMLVVSWAGEGTREVVTQASL